MPFIEYPQKNGPPKKIVGRPIFWTSKTFVGRPIFFEHVWDIQFFLDVIENSIQKSHQNEVLQFNNISTSLIE